MPGDNDHHVPVLEYLRGVMPVLFCLFLSFLIIIAIEVAIFPVYMSHAKLQIQPMQFSPHITTLQWSAVDIRWVDHKQSNCQTTLKRTFISYKVF